MFLVSGSDGCGGGGFLFFLLWTVEFLLMVLVRLFFLLLVTGGGDGEALVLHVVVVLVVVRWPGIYDGISLRPHLMKKMESCIHFLQYYCVKHRNRQITFSKNF